MEMGVIPIFRAESVIGREKEISNSVSESKRPPNVIQSVELNPQCSKDNNPAER